MFRNIVQKPEKSCNAIKDELKSLFVDILLLQRTCYMIHKPAMRPEKYCDLTYKQAVDMQKTLTPRMEQLCRKLSEKDLFEVDDAAKEEVAAIIDQESTHSLDIIIQVVPRPRL